MRTRSGPVEPLRRLGRSRKAPVGAARRPVAGDEGGEFPGPFGEFRRRTVPVVPAVGGAVRRLLPDHPQQVGAEPGDLAEGRVRFAHPREGAGEQEAGAEPLGGGRRGGGRLVERREQRPGDRPVVHEVGGDRRDPGERREGPGRARGTRGGERPFELGQGVLGARREAADGDLSQQQVRSGDRITGRIRPEQPVHHLLGGCRVPLHLETVPRDAKRRVIGEPALRHGVQDGFEVAQRLSVASARVELLGAPETPLGGPFELGVGPGLGQERRRSRKPDQRRKPRHPSGHWEPVEKVTRPPENGEAQLP